MKTHDAFAFRDFDSARILSRPYFKSLREEYQLSGTDEEILSQLKPADEDSAAVLESKLRTIKETYESLQAFRRLIIRHCQTRCDRYNKALCQRLGVKLTELKRSAPTFEYVTAEWDCMELADKFAKRYSEFGKIIQERYREDFAARLKKLRTAAGLTQKELGELIQVSSQGISNYERAERDVPIHVLVRLAGVFKISGDEILGLSK